MFKRRRNFTPRRFVKKSQNVERHRYPAVTTVALVGAGSTVSNTAVFTVPEITTSASQTMSIPCKATGFKVQFQNSRAGTTAAYGVWALVFVEKGDPPPTLATSGEITDGPRNAVIDSGTWYSTTAADTGYQYIYEPKVSRKMKGGDSLYFQISMTSTGASSVVFTSEIDFTIIT